MQEEEISLSSQNEGWSFSLCVLNRPCLVYSDPRREQFIFILGSFTPAESPLLNITVYFSLASLDFFSGVSHTMKNTMNSTRTSFAVFKLYKLLHQPWHERQLILFPFFFVYSGNQGVINFAQKTWCQTVSFHCISSCLSCYCLIFLRSASRDMRTFYYKFVKDANLLFQCMTSSWKFEKSSTYDSHTSVSSLTFKSLWFSLIWYDIDSIVVAK